LEKTGESLGFSPFEIRMARTAYGQTLLNKLLYEKVGKVFDEIIDD